MNRLPCRHPAARPGLTTVELMLAAVVLALVGLGVAAMLGAAGHADRSDAQLRRAVVGWQTLDARLAAAVRGSAVVLDHGETWLVLWDGDHSESGEVNLSELRRVELDPDTGELRSYRAPDDLPAAHDTAFDLDADDFGDITADLRGQANFPASRWAAGVGDWLVRTDAPHPRDARMVFYRLDPLDPADGPVIGAAALRGH